MKKNGSLPEKPHCSEIMEPEVSGVLVVSEGGDDRVTVRERSQRLSRHYSVLKRIKSK